MEDEECPYCRMDRVQLQDALPCVWKSLRGLYRDFCVQGERDVLSVLGRDDRILYVLAIVVLLMLSRLVILG